MGRTNLPVFLKVPPARSCKNPRFRGSGDSATRRRCECEHGVSGNRTISRNLNGKSALMARPESFPHNPELTKLLLQRGADPNDEETPYHVPESYHNAALMILVESGKLTSHSLATMLLRKADWHDTDGIEFLLTHGAAPESNDALALHGASSSVTTRQPAQKY